MSYTTYRGIMAGRFTAQAIIFATSVTSTEARFETQSIQQSNNFFGRISFRRRAVENSLSSSLNQSLESSNLDVSQWLEKKHETIIKMNKNVLKPDMEAESSEKNLLASVRTRRRPSFQKEDDGEDEEEKNSKKVIDPVILKSVTQPFVPKSIWSQLEGNEYDQPDVIDDLVETALSLTKSEDSEWIKWKAQNCDNADSPLSDDDVRVHVGKCQKSDADQYYGANLPVIKTEARIPISPREIADLLLDSSRVQIYNKMSIGRTDIRSVACEKGVAKIVKNITKPPLTKKKIESVTFMHSRPLDDVGTYIVVSRAVTLPFTETTTTENQDDVEEYGKSEILLGVNLLEPCGGDSSKMTSITHVYSSALPTLVAKRVGVNSATNFVNDIRGVCKDTKGLEE